MSQAVFENCTLTLPGYGDAGGDLDLSLATLHYWEDGSGNLALQDDTYYISLTIAEQDDLKLTLPGIDSAIADCDSDGGAGGAVELKDLSDVGNSAKDSSNILVGLNTGWFSVPLTEQLVSDFGPYAAADHGHTVSEVTDAGDLMSLASVGPDQIDADAIETAKIAPTGVTAGTYNDVNITVNPEGQVEDIANGVGTLLSGPQGTTALEEFDERFSPIGPVSPVAVNKAGLYVNANALSAAPVTLFLTVTKDFFKLNPGDQAPLNPVTPVEGTQYREGTILKPAGEPLSIVKGIENYTYTAAGYDPTNDDQLELILGRTIFLNDRGVYAPEPSPNSISLFHVTSDTDVRVLDATPLDYTPFLGSPEGHWRFGRGGMNELLTEVKDLTGNGLDMPVSGSASLTALERFTRFDNGSYAEIQIPQFNESAVDAPFTIAGLGGRTVDDPDLSQMLMQIGDTESTGEKSLQLYYRNTDDDIFFNAYTQSMASVGGEIVNQNQGISSSLTEAVVDGSVDIDSNRNPLNFFQITLRDSDEDEIAVLGPYEGDEAGRLQDDLNFYFEVDELELTPLEVRIETPDDDPQPTDHVYIDNIPEGEVVNISVEYFRDSGTMWAITYDGSQVTAYINGAKHGPWNISGIRRDPNSRLMFGRWINSAGGYRYAEIDVRDVRYYDRAFSDDEIERLHQTMILDGDADRLRTLREENRVTLTGFDDELADIRQLLGIGRIWPDYCTVELTGNFKLSGGMALRRPIHVKGLGDMKIVMGQRVGTLFSCSHPSARGAVRGSNEWNGEKIDASVDLLKGENTFQSLTLTGDNGQAVPLTEPLKRGDWIIMTGSQDPETKPKVSSGQPFKIKSDNGTIMEFEQSAWMDLNKVHTVSANISNGTMNLALNSWAPVGYTFTIEDIGGTHTGSSNSSTLTDSTQSWVVNELVGRRIRNTSDGSSGIITANTATTITATLSGGGQNDWDFNESYRIGRILGPYTPDNVGEASFAADLANVYNPVEPSVNFYSQSTQERYVSLGNTCNSNCAGSDPLPSEVTRVEVTIDSQIRAQHLPLLDGIEISGIRVESVFTTSQKLAVFGQCRNFKMHDCVGINLGIAFCNHSYEGQIYNNVSYQGIGGNAGGVRCSAACGNIVARNNYIVGGQNCLDVSGGGQHPLHWDVEYRDNIIGQSIVAPMRVHSQGGVIYDGNICHQDFDLGSWGQRTNGLSAGRKVVYRDNIIYMTCRAGNLTHIQEPYQWNTSTAGGDPGSGKIATNADKTEVYISFTDRDGGDRRDEILQVPANLLIRVRDYTGDSQNNSQNMEFRTSEHRPDWVVDNGTYATFQVRIYDEDPGSSANFTNNQDVWVQADIGRFSGIRIGGPEHWVIGNEIYTVDQGVEIGSGGSGNPSFINVFLEDNFIKSLVPYEWNSRGVVESGSGGNQYVDDAYTTRNTFVGLNRGIVNYIGGRNYYFNNTFLDCDQDITFSNSGSVTPPHFRNNIGN